MSSYENELIEWESNILQRTRGMSKEEADRRAAEDWEAYERDMKEGRPWQ